MPRRCKRVDLGDGTFALITVEVRMRTCKGCGARMMEDRGNLCDWKVDGKKRSKTCDAFVCNGCARRVGPDKDLCPAHAKMWDEHPKNTKEQR